MCFNSSDLEIRERATKMLISMKIYEIVLEEILNKVLNASQLLTPINRKERKKICLTRMDSSFPSCVNSVKAP